MNYIVAEGQRDAALLRQILPVEGGETTFLSAGGASALVSLVRTLLRQEANRVLVVTDADSLNPEPRRSFVEKMLSEIAPPERDPDRWRVYVFTPELESLPFEYPASLTAVFGRPLTDLEAVRGRYEPKKTLAELLPREALEEWWLRIDPKPLGQSEAIQGMLQFLQSSPVVVAEIR